MWLLKSVLSFFGIWGFRVLNFFLGSVRYFLCVFLLWVGFLILNGSINLFFAILAVNVEISVTLFRVLDFWIWLWIFLTNLGMINGEFFFFLVFASRVLNFFSESFGGCWLLSLTILLFLLYGKQKVNIIIYSFCWKNRRPFGFVWIWFSLFSN